ncbi:MAG: hypothetical protein ACYTGZ_05150 [Planctomycetota bacterium]|jgi:hypothetical protein
MSPFIRSAMPVGLLALVVLVGSQAGLAGIPDPGAGQDLWRSCSACHCVPDARIPADEYWLKLNETTTCIAGERDTPETRKDLISYLRSKKTIRPLLIDELYEAPAGVAQGKIRVPSTAGSAYLKAERKSVREGTPPKIRLHWKDSKKGTILTLPEGEFRVISYCFYRADKQKRLWVASGSSAEGCTELTISRDKEATLELLPEIQANLSSTASKDGLVLGFFMTNRNNKRMSLSREGKLVNPTWVITSAKGERIDAGDFEVT